MNPLTADWYFAFNTRRAPFNNVKARQAVNLAADRNAYVKIGGGPSLAVPTCQVLPPNFPGYKPYCPYTAGGGTTKWTGPDLTKARALVKASGTAGAKVVVNTDIPDKALGEQMVSDLNKIGYKASLQVLAGTIQYAFVQNSNNSQKWNIAWSAWYQDYPTASDFLNVLLGCGTIHPGSDASPNIAAFCDPAIQKQMNKALSLGRHGPGGRQQHLGSGRSRGDRPGTVGRPVQPQADRLPVQGCPRIPMEPPVVHPHRSAVGEVGPDIAISGRSGGR